MIYYDIGYFGDTDKIERKVKTKKIHIKVVCVRAVIVVPRTEQTEVQV